MWAGMAQGLRAGTPLPDAWVCMVTLPLASYWPWASYFTSLHPSYLICKMTVRTVSTSGTSLVVQWLRLCASTAEGVGSIPSGGTKIPHASQHGQRKKNTTNFTLLLWGLNFHTTKHSEQLLDNCSTEIRGFSPHFGGLNIAQRTWDTAPYTHGRMRFKKTTLQYGMLSQEWGPHLTFSDSSD